MRGFFHSRLDELREGGGAERSNDGCGARIGGGALRTGGGADRIGAGDGVARVGACGNALGRGAPNAGSDRGAAERTLLSARERSGA